MNCNIKHQSFIWLSSQNQLNKTETLRHNKKELTFFAAAWAHRKYLLYGLWSDFDIRGTISVPHQHLFGIPIIFPPLRRELLPPLDAPDTSLEAPDIMILQKQR